MNPGDLSAPGEWYGEYLWRITFNVPKDVVTLLLPPVCHRRRRQQVLHRNNDGVCQDNEKDEECGDCCDNDGICEPPNEQEPWCNDCSPPTPTTGYDPTTGNGDVDTNTTIDSADQLDDDGCGCDVDESPTQGVLASLALLGLLGIRRRRQS
jgi:MYXO-CTERM domain-containing protein